ncbi:hypothetical protein FA13DRAFT_1886764 [Coprinellus micaceus]|uniref:DUF6533 domain-containing protein n=1 Tax=Coprinellus micaceus TaxID=71717 RepID=A0A4Y7RR43_COPMI|nr:hypothetical protein FA13DRAFT_1886764 [Coprinellus micaceus]
MRRRPRYHTQPSIHIPRYPMSAPGPRRRCLIGSYVVVGSLAVILWDILQNLPADLKILTQSRIRLPSIVYLVSRLLSLAHVLWSAVFYVSAVGNCADNLLGLSVLYPLSISASDPASPLSYAPRVRRQPSSRWPILRPLVLCVGRDNHSAVWGRGFCHRSY